MTEASFDGKYVKRVFGVPDEVVDGAVVRAWDIIRERRSKGRVRIRRPDEVWPIGRAVARLASVARVSVRRVKGVECPEDALDQVLGDAEPSSPALRTLRSLTRGRCTIGFPVLTPELTLVVWGANTEELSSSVLDLTHHPAVRTLVSLAVLDDVGEYLVDRYDDRAEQLSEALQRAYDGRGARLLGLCLCAWLSEKLGGEFETWWNEGGGWRALYSVVRESELVESTVRERVGVEPGK
ncbi:hypothetical protein [Methanopyrus kandleri]|uniref:Uncharacterized protein n=2 Tax=Methanopyrus kandleri TaxID=2320 RepID=Q8TYI9_METKA|nr:hypothetical protein [Methanopyrus kandleri]AAM01525.1 Uncharacterized protein MK0308 [Methanopyrus kandleri AV19]HII70545.1 hypothetical protein [Methanopyrus kandleri]